jgi:hypothetical protein
MRRGRRRRDLMSRRAVGGGEVIENRDRDIEGWNISNWRSESLPNRKSKNLRQTVSSSMAI